MDMISRNHSFARILRRAAVPLLALGLIVASVMPAVAAAAATVARPDEVIVLPGATSAEGIAAGAGSTFYAGDLYRGTIYRGDIRRGTATRFIDAPERRAAWGMKADLRHGLLLVAGGPTGQAYVYSTRTGATVATYQLGAGGQLGAAGVSVINDVALVPGGAWFTDSARAKLYFVPVSAEGTPGTARTLDLTGPAADVTGAFNVNGIQATPDGRTLIVSHTQNARLYTVNPVTGASAPIEGAEVPNADGILLNGHRLWVVENRNNKIVRFRLSPDLSHATPDKTITSKSFGVPTTVALFGDRLAAVNAHFDTGTPPTSNTYEVVVVSA
jgi:sugar lactone lactonase YvrE